MPATREEYVVSNQKWFEKPTPQRDKRSHHTMTDQFGRQWETTLDITAKPKPAPVGPISPLGWHDPLMTPDKYKKFDPHNVFRLTIDVDKWIAELGRSNKEWEQRLYVEARNASPIDNGAALIGKGGADVSPALLDKLGVRPQPLEFILALKSGNQWASGQTPTMPNWAAPLVSRLHVNSNWNFLEDDMNINDLDTLRAQFPDAEDEGTAKPKRGKKEELA